MKMPVSWHKEVLANSESWSAETERRIQSLQAELQKAREKQAFYRAQIERAEAEGRDGFDEEKFGIRRAK
jgi:hypothetical protein